MKKLLKKFRQLPEEKRKEVIGCVLVALLFVTIFTVEYMMVGPATKKFMLQTVPVLIFFGVLISPWMIGKIKCKVEQFINFIDKKLFHPEKA